MNFLYSIREWRDDYSDNLSVEKLLDISQDLLEGIDSNQVQKNFKVHF